MAQEGVALFSSWLNSVREENKLKTIMNKRPRPTFHAKEGCDEHKECREYNKRLTFWNENIKPEIDYLKQVHVALGGRFVVVLTSSGIIDDQKLLHTPNFWDSWNESELSDFFGEVYQSCHFISDLVTKARHSIPQPNRFWIMPYSSSYTK